MENFNGYSGGGYGTGGYNGGNDGRSGTRGNAQGGRTGNPGLPNDLFRMVSSLAARFDGKNQNDLIRAIYEEALRGKRAGTLSNADIDNFVAMLAPMLDDKKRKMLYRVAEELKRI